MRNREIIHQAESLLETAMFGLEDLKRRDGRSKAGLLSAIMAGRAVTFALQNLRNLAPGFEDWYAEKVAQMSANPFFQFVCDARTQIEKQGKGGFDIGVRIDGRCDVETITRTYPPPQDAYSLFVGDDYGGSGYMTKDGHKYYVDMSDLGINSGFFPPLKLKNIHKIEAADGLEEYLEFLRNTITEAKERFL